MVTTALHIDTVDEKRLQYRLSERNLTGLDTSTIKTAVQTLLPLINAKGIYDELPYDLCTDSFGGKAPFAVEGEQIIPFLQQAETIIAMSVTLGKDIDDYIDKFFTSGDFATGMLADCTAAAALDTLLNRLTEIIDITYSRDELKTAWRRIIKASLAGGILCAVLQEMLFASLKYVVQHNRLRPVGTN